MKNSRSSNPTTAVANSTKWKWPEMKVALGDEESHALGYRGRLNLKSNGK